MASPDIIAVDYFSVDLAWYTTTLTQAAGALRFRDGVFFRAAGLGAFVRGTLGNCSALACGAQQDTCRSKMSCERRICRVWHPSFDMVRPRLGSMTYPKLSFKLRELSAAERVEC